ncbi:hypothetical protein [Antrihabitans cavernicola]|uniref:Lipoprotein n=1 Tax=Antrihabitans cavernicola TaxID=2495913 RepID=A0A5A7SDM5_9NOCA|nr:hypothetical protein [Spelaeibacter cavernicola]KAA0024250.1 hypothetical protein FOY51_06865 [Spelaeibacter cavernicola]
MGGFRKLTRALIVVAAIAVGAATTACGADSTAPASTAPLGAAPVSATYESTDAVQPADSTTAAIAETVDPAGFYGDSASGPGYFFQSPTGNVTCGMGFDNVNIGTGCQAKVSVPSTTGVTCLNGGNSVYSNSLISGAAVSRCVNQPFYVGGSGTGENLGGRVLEYGQSISMRGSTCTSTVSGITCSGGDFGFTLARDRNEIR